MIFADKLILLRKKAGWSQEELSEQMNVSRQSVSKWEAAQSVPDLKKLIQLSELFGVSTDYLLKDDMEEVEYTGRAEDIPALRRVTMEEAHTFMAVKARTAKSTAYAVFLCILSPVCLLLLGAISETGKYGISEAAAGGIGMVTLFLLVAIAVAVFISCGYQTAPFAYLEKEKFETEYGVVGLVKECREQYRKTYQRNNLMGTALCITALIPFFLGVMIDENNDLLLMGMLSLLFLLVGIGVILFVRSGIVWASFEKLLQEGDYSRAKKEKNPLRSAICTAYWMVTLVIFLICNFVGGKWGSSWLIWVIAGVLFPAAIALTDAVIKEKP